MRKTSSWVITGVISLIVLIVLLMWGLPRYGVYSKTLKGKAALAEATYNRDIAVKEAEAEFDAAVFKKATDSLRAVGTAIAVGIINEQLTTRYIQWKWVEGLHDGSSEVIYVPTESNIPIMEASARFKKRGVNVVIEE